MALFTFKVAGGVSWWLGRAEGGVFRGSWQGLKQALWEAPGNGP